MPTRALIRSFVEAAPHVAWSNRPDGTTEFVNRQLLAYSGLELDYLLGNIWTFLVHPDDRGPALELRARSIAAQQAYCVELRFRRADGVYRWHSAHVAPLRDAAGELIAWYGSALDIDDRRRTTEALRESEARFRAVFESAAIGVARVGFDGARWLEVNDAFCHILGYDRSELIGRTWIEFTHPEDVMLDSNPFQQMAAGEIENYTVEKRFIHKKGHPVWARLTLSLVRNARGEPDFEVCLVEDISSRKEAETALRISEARFRSLVGAISRIVWTCSASGEQMDPQPAWEAFTGQTPEEVKDGGWLNAVHAEDREMVKARWNESIHTRQTCDIEYRVRRRDGVWRWMHFRAVPVLDESGAVREWVGANADITERKQAEDDLRRSNEDLERFAYVAGHDLQEPLRQVVSYSQLLEQLYGQKLEGDASEFLKIIVDGARRMQKLVRDLLHLARPAVRITSEQVDAGEVLAEAISSVRKRLEETGGSITFDQLPAVITPRPVLAQVFQNLLSNALKYRHETRPPQIHVSAQRNETEWIFSVKDNGQGIPPEYQDRIFAWFTRVPGTKASGNGVGLASVGRMLERVGGRIWVESEVEVGSTFRFTVPLPDGMDGVPQSLRSSL